jgi:hypothetical protein
MTNEAYSAALSSENNRARRADLARQNEAVQAEADLALTLAQQLEASAKRLREQARALRAGDQLPGWLGVYIGRVEREASAAGTAFEALETARDIAAAEAAASDRRRRA